MPDNQWPTFQVFVQERPESPHQHVGSVHAPDSELALLNARDVYTRRPECYSLWVVPAGAVYSRTLEQLQQESEAAPADSSEQSEPYCVCCKARSAGTMTFLGIVTAQTPAAALAQARQAHSGAQPFAWWVFPQRLVVQSQAEDVPSMFAPAEDKPFRLASDFKTHTAMRHIKEK